MNRIVKKTFENIPCLEVLFRHVFFHSKKRVKKFNKKHKKTPKVFDAQFVERFLKDNLREGDIVIAHTRMSALKLFGYNPNTIIELILKIIGPSGTLFIPAMPYYEELFKEKTFKCTFDDVLAYDSEKTPSWTGVVGNVFINDFSARRSLMPYCSLAGKGPFVAKAFSNELDDDYIFSVNSPWHKLMEANAKIIFLGAEAYDSITEAHVVEDSCPDFKINGWHFLVKFKINKNIEKEYWIRKPFWNKYLTEFYNIKQLKKNGIISLRVKHNVELSCISSFKSLYDYYCKNITKNTLFRIPKKYLKG